MNGLQFKLSLQGTGLLFLVLNRIPHPWILILDAWSQAHTSKTEFVRLQTGSRPVDLARRTEGGRRSGGLADVPSGVVPPPGWAQQKLTKMLPDFLQNLAFCRPHRQRFFQVNVHFAGFLCLRTNLPEISKLCIIRPHLQDLLEFVNGNSPFSL